MNKENKDIMIGAGALLAPLCLMVSLIILSSKTFIDILCEQGVINYVLPDTLSNFSVFLMFFSIGMGIVVWFYIDKNP